MQATIIYNPWAGPLPAKGLVERAARRLSEFGWTVEIRPTERSGDARRLARQAADSGAQVVIAAGGDGTLSQAADALAGTQTAVGVLPLGTANLWAQEVGLMRVGELPPPVERVAAALVSATVREVDLGQIEKRHFMLWCGVGLDGHVVSRIEPRNRLAKLLGLPYYVVVAAVAALNWRGRAQSVTVDGRAIGGQLFLTLIGNSRLYGGGFFKPSPAAQMDDGLLDVSVVEASSFVEAVGVIWNPFRRAGNSPGLRQAAGREISIEGDRRIPIQVDGEYFGRRRSIQISVRSRALRVLVPNSAPSDLFVAGGQAAGPVVL